LETMALATDTTDTSYCRPRVAKIAETGVVICALVLETRKGLVRLLCVGLSWTSLLRQDLHDFHSFRKTLLRLKMFWLEPGIGESLSRQFDRQVFLAGEQCRGVAFSDCSFTSKESVANLLSEAIYVSSY
jgi:hypothetical protein